MMIVGEGSAPASVILLVALNLFSVYPASVPSDLHLKTVPLGMYFYKLHYKEGVFNCSAGQGEKI